MTFMFNELISWLTHHGVMITTKAQAAARSGIPQAIRPQIVALAKQPATGDEWLHEIKYDGHRLIAIAQSGELKLISRNGYDRTPLFSGPFRKLAASGRRIVLDAEIAVPDERGVTHIDSLSDALAGRQPERLTYFAFDLLYLEEHDLRCCPIEERKALRRRALDEAECERLVYVDHIIGRGAQLFERVREVGAEGIVSKGLGSLYRCRESRDWL
jgi:bifunctional non-homologous end joining protein LigD